MADVGVSRVTASPHSSCRSGNSNSFCCCCGSRRSDSSSSSSGKALEYLGIGVLRLPTKTIVNYTPGTMHDADMPEAKMDRVFLLLALSLVDARLYVCPCCPGCLSNFVEKNAELYWKIARDAGGGIVIICEMWWVCSFYVTVLSLLRGGMYVTKCGLSPLPLYTKQGKQG